MARLDFIQNYANLFEIDITPSADAPTWARLAAGINNVSWNGNETVDQADYYDGEGCSESDVTGGNPVASFSGHRRFGDAAQDYVAGLRYQYGKARRTKLRWTEPDGAVTVCPVTVSNIVSQGGGPKDKGTFSFDASFNGLPTFTEGAADGFPTGITASAVSVKKGATASVSATVAPSGASSALVYLIEDEDKASVSSDGIVTGIAAGETTLVIKSAVKPTVGTSVKVTVTAS